MLDYAWQALILLATCIVIHEAGHYIAFRAYKIRPSMRITWWGINMGYKNEHWKLTVRQYLITLNAGILAGAIPLMWVHDARIVLFYVLLCAVDIMCLVGVYTLGGGKQLNKKVGLLVYEDALKTMKETRKWTT